MKHTNIPLDILISFLRNNNLPLSEAIIERFSIYLSFLQETPYNITAIKNPTEIIVKHFIDSIFIAKFYNNLKNNIKIIDVGTGGGFPGIPIKILFPKIQLTLVESVKKKTKFLKDLIDKLDISGIIIINERAEVVGHDPSFRETFDLVVSRAVASLPVLLEVTACFARVDGEVVAYKSGDVRVELRESVKALELLRLITKDIYFYKLPIIEHKRSLLFLEKVGKTPDRYPRRPGIPQKRPLT